MFNFIALTLPTTGQTPKQQLLKQDIQRDSQELKVGGEGNDTHVCMAFLSDTVASVITVSMVVLCCVPDVISRL